MAKADSLSRLLQFTDDNGLQVTSGEHIKNGQAVVPHSGHSRNSLHYVHRAVDVEIPPAEQQQAVVDAAKREGFVILKENYRGQGPFGYSTGPHWHIESPYTKVSAGLDSIQQMAVEIANKYDIPPAKLLALVQRESSFDPQATSTTKSGRSDVGLGQLSPAVALQFGVKDRTDARQNLEGTAQYFRQQYDRYGDWDIATAAYVGGPQGIQSGKVAIPKQNQYETLWEQRLGAMASTSPDSAGNPAAASPPPDNLASLTKYSTGMTANLDKFLYGGTPSASSTSSEPVSTPKSLDSFLYPSQQPSITPA